jgi:hypothetical protein
LWPPSFSRIHFIGRSTSFDVDFVRNSWPEGMGSRQVMDARMSFMPVEKLNGAKGSIRRRASEMKERICKCISWRRW